MARPVTPIPTSEERATRPLAARLGACLPLAGLAVVLVTLAHSQPRPETPDSIGTDPFHDISLMSPDKRVSAAKTILLRNQYRYYLRFQKDGPQSYARQDAVRKYNIFTSECSPDVFEKTHLPRSVR